MNDWIKLVRDYYAEDFPNSPDGLWFGEPAREDQISAFEKKIGVSYPCEFHDFYLTLNGFGLRENEGVDWIFYAIGNMECLIVEARDWFGDTHPELANRFLPFIRLGSGGYLGYLKNEYNLVSGEIYEFDHESYFFDGNQDVEDFLMMASEGIDRFLRNR